MKFSGKRAIDSFALTSRANREEILHAYHDAKHTPGNWSLNHNGLIFIPSPKMNVKVVQRMDTNTWKTLCKGLMKIHCSSWKENWRAYTKMLLDDYDYNDLLSQLLGEEFFENLLLRKTFVLRTFLYFIVFWSLISSFQNLVLHVVRHTSSFTFKKTYFCFDEMTINNKWTKLTGISSFQYSKPLQNCRKYEFGIYSCHNHTFLAQ